MPTLLEYDFEKILSSNRAPKYSHQLEYTHVSYYKSHTRRRLGLQHGTLAVPSRFGFEHTTQHHTQRGRYRLEMTRTNGFTCQVSLQYVRGGGQEIMPLPCRAVAVRDSGGWRVGAKFATTPRRLPS